MDSSKPTKNQLDAIIISDIVQFVAQKCGVTDTAGNNINFIFSSLSVIILVSLFYFLATYPSSEKYLTKFVWNCKRARIIFSVTNCKF